MTVVKRLGETAREVRFARGRTLEDVAASAGVDAAQLSRLERGEAPHTGVPVWTDVAKALGYTFGEFVRCAYPDAR